MAGASGLLQRNDAFLLPCCSRDHDSPHFDFTSWLGKRLSNQSLRHSPKQRRGRQLRFVQRAVSSRLHLPTHGRMAPQPSWKGSFPVSGAQSASTGEQARLRRPSCSTVHFSVALPRNRNNHRPFDVRITPRIPYLDELEPCRTREGTANRRSPSCRHQRTDC